LSEVLVGIEVELGLRRLKAMRVARQRGIFN